MTAIDRVLVAFDGTPLSEEALEHALEVYPDAEVIVLHVIDYVEESYTARAPVGDETVRERARRRSEGLLDDAEAIAAEHNRSVTTTSRVGKATDEILAQAEADDADIIVIGSHGRRRLSEILLGSVAETVQRRASVPVTVVR
ncbi:MAG: universal stress protein [Halobacteriales archaeon]